MEDAADDDDEFRCTTLWWPFLGLKAAAMAALHASPVGLRTREADLEEPEPPLMVAGLSHNTAGRCFDSSSDDVAGRSIDCFMADDEAREGLAAPPPAPATAGGEAEDARAVAAAAEEDDAMAETEAPAPSTTEEGFEAAFMAERTRCTCSGGDAHWRGGKENGEGREKERGRKEWKMIYALVTL